VEKVRKKIYQSKSIPDVHKFVLRSKIFSAGCLQNLMRRRDLRWPTQLKNISQLFKWLDTKLNIPISIKTPRYKDGVVLTFQKIHRI
jgi:hypothetical protein